jgi:hypothetical protein
MLNSKKEKNREKWAGYIDTQESSGLPQKKWCEANQVNHHNFRYWRQRLKKEDTDLNQAVISEETEGKEIFEFARVLIQPEGNDGDTTVKTAMMSAIQLTIRGMVLTIPSTYDETFLLGLIRTLNRL